MRITNTVLTVISLCTGIGALPLASYAADLPAYQPEPYANVYGDAGLGLATEGWTGFYAGAHIGDVTTDELDRNFNAGNLRVSGGVQAGYLHQFDMFVIGAELEGSLGNNLTYELTPGAGVQETWSIAAKGRAGVAVGDTLVYGTAGVTMANLKGTGGATLDKETLAGFVFGGGVEQRLSENISLRAEYLQTQYLDLGSTVAGAARSDDLTSHAVNVGLNFRF